MVIFFRSSVSGELPPAPGFRSHADGALWGVGNAGFCWSSTVNGINGMCLDFYAMWLYPRYADCRAYGFLLRYLSE